jgi:quercetin dioxygenase-like cupin family protein
MFYRQEKDGYTQPVPGVAMKTLVHGEKTQFVEFKLEAGHALPMHTHPEEQTGYLVSGAIMLTIGDERFKVAPGDSWCIPGNVPHGAEIMVDSVAVEVFSPVRKEYLP